MNIIKQLEYREAKMKEEIKTMKKYDDIMINNLLSEKQRMSEILEIKDRQLRRCMEKMQKREEKIR